jgi:Zn finger protein HypA/HybF involved in hydrogenase expression
MGLGHVLGIDDGRSRALCRHCGRTVTVDPDDEGGDACPDCASTDLERITLL